MVNEYDIIKNGLYLFCLNSVCNGNNIVIDTIEQNLNELDLNNLYESKEIIENSKFIKLIVELANEYYLNNLCFADLENIKKFYYDFEEQFYKLFELEQL